MHRIKGLLFDKDGTLFDFHKTWGVWTAGFIDEIAAGPDQAVALGAALGFEAATLSFAADSVVIAGTPDDNIDAISAVLGDVDRDALRARILESSATAPLVAPVPLGPLLEVFEAAGIVMGVATNDSERVARAHLEQAGVLDRFDFIAGFDSGHGAKPAPGMQLAFCGATGLAPEQVAMVGDSLHDLDAGKAAGMKRIAVLTGHAHADVLGPHADVVLPDIGHIPGWIGL